MSQLFGKIVAAHEGTLCLDEIGEMPVELQPYLLRIVEDGVVYPLASNEGRQVRGRYISLTNRDLRQEVAAGRFRRDLYYRLAVLRLTVPPLREHGDDAVLLAEHFLRAIAAKQAGTPPRFDPAVLDLFRRHAWPGNVRQLRNVIESMLVLSRGDRLSLQNVPAEFLVVDTDPARARPAAETPSFATSLKRSEHATIQAVLAECRGNSPRSPSNTGSSFDTVSTPGGVWAKRRSLSDRTVRASSNPATHCPRRGQVDRRHLTVPNWIGLRPDQHRDRLGSWGLAFRIAMRERK